MRIAMPLLFCLLVAQVGLAQRNREIVIDPDQPHRLLRPGGPATQPATRPTAKIDQAAQPAFSKMVAALKSDTRPRLAGEIRFEMSDLGERRAVNAAFSSVLVGHGKFRHETRDEVLVGCDGTTAYLLVPRVQAYQTDAVKSAAFDALPATYRQIVLQNNPVLALRLMADPGKVLGEISRNIRLATPEESAGLAGTVLVLEGAATNTIIAMDADSGLISAVRIDFAPTLAVKRKGDEVSATMTIVYSGDVDQKAADAAEAAFTPPAGARKLSDRGAAGGGPVVADAQAMVGQAAPAFKLPSLAGAPIALEDLKGKVVVLDFWASWCGPCRAALPKYDALQAELGDEVVILAVNVRESRDVAAKFMQTNELKLKTVLDAEGATSAAYGVRGLPTTVIIGRDGVVRNVIVGFSPGSEKNVKAMVEAALKP